jgi:Mn2+/Fe2+ NRAMP family transporter
MNGILGAALGLETITGISQIAINSSFSINIWGPIIGIIAFGLMSFGSYKTIEKLLIFLVILMSVAFISTSIVVAPSWGEILKGTFIPSLPEGSILTVIALIGTTVVPYNLFLHASAVQEKWNDESGLKEARTDILISIAIGGLISMSIVITSATAFMGTETIIKNASDMAFQLKPVLGNWATFFIAFGLFAAGVSSAVTAPLAAAYAIAGILGWKKDFKNSKFKLVWISILLIGILGSAFGLKPIQAIVFAQITNGILLPVIAVYLLWIMNSSSMLGEYRNKLWSNSIGGIVVLIAIALGVKSIVSVLGIG